jgi:hypothetical protein
MNEQEIRAKHETHLEAVAERLKAGDYINQQRVILRTSALITTDGTLPTSVVMVALGSNRTTPFVVWYASWQGTHWAYSAGLYEVTLEGAQEAFEQRRKDFEGRSHAIAMTP